MFGREFQAGEHRQHVVPSPPTGYGFEVIGSRKEARPSESDLLSIVKGIAVSVGFSNARSMKNYDGSYFASLGRDYELFITPTGRDNGYDWSVERKGSGVVREGYGMTSQEIVEDIRGSGVVASRTPPTGYGFEKAGYESLRTADSYQFGGGWSAKIVYENDDEGEYAEAILTGPGGAEETIYPGDGRTFEPGELEDEARQLISEYGDSPYEDTYQYNSSHREASRQETASYHLAFFDGFDIPEPRHRVAGWDWDDHLNGFLAAEAAREFTCACGESVPAPGYTDCRCGRRWNAYTIQANGSKKMIAREVPVRDGVVMASRTANRTAGAGDWVQAYDGANEWKCKTNPRLYILEEDDGYYLFDNIELIEVTHTLEQAIELGESSHVAGRKQAESGVPKFREGDMVIGRGPDMDTHTLREVGSVVEQDGGYFYRLRKLHGSGPGGSRLYAEEHLEGYRLQR